MPVATPVSAKIRLGCSDNCQTAIEVAQRVEEAGAVVLLFTVELPLNTSKAKQIGKQSGR